MFIRNFAVDSLALLFAFLASHAVTQTAQTSEETTVTETATTEITGERLQRGEDVILKRPAEPTSPQDHPFVGMWVTQDGHIRHELLSNGRYDEARGTRESAYQGRYKVTGNIVQYWDDTGFYADGQFQGGVLYHGGMFFYRQE